MRNIYKTRCGGFEVADKRQGLFHKEKHAAFCVQLSRRLCSFSLVTEAPCNLLNHFVISSDSLKMRGLQPWLLKRRT